VCPFNNPKFVQLTTEPAFRGPEGVHGAEPIELMGMDQAEFSADPRSRGVGARQDRGGRGVAGAARETRGGGGRLGEGELELALAL
jgi:hypothetical protein